MKVGDVMTKRVLSVKPEDTVGSAIHVMLKAGISGLPVIDAGGKLVGVVTEGDFLRRAETGTERRRPRWLEFLIGPGRLAGEYAHTHARKVSEVMSADAVAVGEDTPLDEAVRLMERHRIKRLPVLKGQRVVGMLTRADLLRALEHLAPEAQPAAASDREIRERIMAELERQPWNPRGLANIIVRRGVVDLAGVIFDERERDALRVAAENIPGVKEVRDRLVWMEPVSGAYIPPPVAAPTRIRARPSRGRKHAVKRAK
ncbi:MAG TPA: CBS domain-containing protein [Alphaproteobacteria bacterium]